MSSPAGGMRPAGSERIWARRREAGPLPGRAQPRPGMTGRGPSRRVTW
jgi:hypothetical protein